MNDILFLIDRDVEGGYNARAENESIFTQADTLPQLNLNVKDAIECHYDGEVLPGFVLKFV